MPSVPLPQGQLAFPLIPTKDGDGLRVKSNRMSYERTISHKVKPYADDLRRLYLDEHRSSVEVGKILGLPYYLVLRYARFLSIPVRDRSDAQRKRMGTLNLSGELAGVLDGELLGDGSLIHPANSDAYFSCGTTRRGYIEWLGERLNALGLHSNLYLDKPAWKSSFSEKRVSAIHTRRYPELSALRRRWYPDNIKAIPRDLVLTPFACLHWYLGDGCLNNPLPTARITLSTHCFVRCDVEWLADRLSEIVGKAQVSDHPNGPVIIMNKYAATHFLRYIGACPDGLADVYGYKWRREGG